MEDLCLCVKKVEELSCTKQGKKRVYHRPMAKVINLASYLMGGTDTNDIPASGTPVTPPAVEAKNGVFEDLSQENPDSWGDPWSDE